ncbi:hypothetical protein ANO11243_033270 [Dothideomycetidae sp. 11243]|nr:hypothetical protein ANO11243_033270 [fungal sp. No.11243]
MAEPDHQPPISKVSTNTQTTWQTTTSGSSSTSASRYGLDVDDPASILVFDWDGSIEKTSQRRLCAELDRDGSRRVTKKEIPKGCAYVEVRRHDLYLPYERELYKRLPNYNSSLASIRLPSSVYWSRYFFGSYDKLYIVSPEMSPANSPTESFDGPKESEFAAE